MQIIYCLIMSYVTVRVCVYIYLLQYREIEMIISLVADGILTKHSVGCCSHPLILIEFLYSSRQLPIPAATHVAEVLEYEPESRS